MVTAIVLLEVERGRINDVAQKLLAIDQVSEVYSVAGQYDLVAIVRTPKLDGLADVVTRGMLQLDGIRRSETLTAFRAYSRHDLDRMFAIGLEDPA